MSPPVPQLALNPCKPAQRRRLEGTGEDWRVQADGPIVAPGPSSTVGRRMTNWFSARHRMRSPSRDPPRAAARPQPDGAPQHGKERCFPHVPGFRYETSRQATSRRGRCGIGPSGHGLCALRGLVHDGAVTACDLCLVEGGVGGGQRVVVCGRARVKERAAARAGLPVVLNATYSAASSSVREHESTY